MAKQLSRPKIYKFHKSLFPNAAIRAFFQLQRNEIVQQIKQSQQQNPSLLKRQKKSSFLAQQCFQDYDHKDYKISSHENSRFINDQSEEQKIQQLERQKNQLYKMSESLYEQLKKCICQRDQYLQQLREKQLSQQRIRQQLQFLKLKLQEESNSISTRKYKLQESQELQKLKKQNSSLKIQLQYKDNELKQLKRQVKEAFVAIESFKKEALEARSQLIIKESEISSITKQNKFLDPYQCIEELYEELENRKFYEPYYFKEPQFITYQVEQAAIKKLKRRFIMIFTQILQKLKNIKDKQWLKEQKILLQSQIDTLLNQ